ncbi:TonB-dependent receptor domain-containing protein, partial [Klebsiella pneumoniae]|uniref:TonB-dependent receptor domain-containing protein n=1 Tax=Klebsiella pneumoniae TaxID=573 RepID=UPI0025A1DCF9
EPGIYAEYTYNIPEKFSLVLGLRGDWMGASNIDKLAEAASVVNNTAYYSPKESFVVTPRSHIRWDITPSTVLRASAGLGYRRASIFTDNIWI